MDRATHTQQHKHTDASTPTLQPVVPLRVCMGDGPTLPITQRLLVDMPDTQDKPHVIVVVAIAINKSLPPVCCVNQAGVRLTSSTLHSGAHKGRTPLCKPVLCCSVVCAGARRNCNPPCHPLLLCCRRRSELPRGQANAPCPNATFVWRPTINPKPAVQNTTPPSKQLQGRGLLAFPPLDTLCCSSSGSSSRDALLANQPDAVLLCKAN